MDRLRVVDGVAPAEVVVPSLHSDIAEHRPATSQPDRPRTIHVPQDFVVIEREEGGDFLVPFGHGLAAIEIELVVLPNPDNRRGDLQPPGECLAPCAQVGRPAVERIVPALLVEPVPVLNGEVDPVLELPEHGGESRQVPIGRLAVSAGKLEAEVEEAVGVVVGVPDIGRMRKCLERVNTRLGPARTRNDKLIEVLGVWPQAVDLDPPRVVPLQRRGNHGRALVEIL